MIGAMPAVAVRHERRRAEKRSGRRPSQLPLQAGRPGEVDATPSPDRYGLEYYFCGKSSKFQMAALHAVVGSLLLGVVLLVVGLVQLSPGAEAAQHRYYLLGCGAILLGLGIIGAFLRCFCISWYESRFYPEDMEAAAHPPLPASHPNTPGQHEKQERPKLKTQVSIAREVDIPVKQPSVAIPIET